MNNKKKLLINEATGAGSAGHYKIPVIAAPQIWKDSQLGPFTERVAPDTNAQLAYTENMGYFDADEDERKKAEAKTRLASKVDMYLKQFYTNQNDDDGSNFGELDSTPLGNIEEQLLREDLAVWFGTKKKPKGSKQPKGPWVNICRKENGKHPPCGRFHAEDKGYPKCRAVGVASKMSASEKRSACQQKRNAEKTHSKAGTGNKPKMTHYEPKNESIKDIIKKVLRENTN
jgi:hypothetical protein